MDFAYVILAGALLVSAAIVAFALRRPAASVPPDPRLDTVLAAQGNITGQFQQTLDAQARLQTMLAERIEALDKRLGETLGDSATKTAATISSIGERLTVIDEAQKNIFALSGQVTSLQQVLSNKQARGAFAQAVMEDIVRDGLPAGLYEFQGKLSNGKQPDCKIFLPGNKACVIVDSKFPLESFKLLRAAGTEEDRKTAMAQVRQDVSKHIGDIAEKYLVEGETLAPAIMFVPSESIYADLDENFADVMQKAHRSQVVIVSPNILMLALTTIQSLSRGARMREQASLIQKEVGVLVVDVKRLGDRVENLQRHFNQAEADMKDIGVSTGKIVSRGEKIEKVELGGADDQALTGD